MIVKLKLQNNDNNLHCQGFSSWRKVKISILSSTRKKQIKVIRSRQNFDNHWLKWPAERRNNWPTDNDIIHVHRGRWGKSGHFYCFCLGNFLNESSEAIDFHVKVAFTHGFKADIVISRVGPYGAHIFKKTWCGPIYPRWGKSGHF